MKWQSLVRSVSCVSCLGLFTLFELFSAAGTALSHFASSWERVLGWFLFLLPIELVAATVLLFSRTRARLGYYLVLLNLLLYAGFFVGEMSASRGGFTSRANWLVLGIWIIFFAAALLSARFMIAGAESSQNTPQPADNSKQTSLKG